jgi:hypothetical protein
MAEEIDRHTRLRFDAFLGHHVSFWTYLDTYKNAFNALLDHTAKSNHNVDRVAYPMLFMARHILELGFKANIRYFQAYSKRDDYTNAGTHDLEKLFAAFKLHIFETIKNFDSTYGFQIEEDDKRSFNEYCSEVEKLTTLMHVLDKGSDAFRYPVNKSNEKVFELSDKVNLLDIQELLEKSLILLVYTRDVFSKYTDYADEIEHSYEQEMRAMYE